MGRDYVHHFGVNLFRKVGPWIGRPDFRKRNEGTSLSEDESENVDKHLSDLQRQPSRWLVSTVVLIDCLHFEWLFLYVLIQQRKDLLQDVTFRSFSGQEKAGNKNRKFSDLVPFPLPVSGEVPLFLPVIMGRKIDSDLTEL